ncbi:endonuclease/exonuclease/phosphatase family protein [Actinoplanes regularis]|uniref:endonuclease/exonuclease/phosphatase family protein n=1 Tax=Actinoplanes regularis TaxID=52697 RepID=UPI0025550EB4|nr:endonuclease/exonuclease/phosphatase family protein [Actinoplanes regularis]
MSRASWTATDGGMKIPTTRFGRARTLLLWAAVLPTFAWAVLRAGGWTLEMLAPLFAFTPYAAIWSLILLGAAFWLRRYAAASCVFVAALLLFLCVVPRALPGADRGPRTGVALHVLTANTLAGTADPATLVRLVRENDVGVLALQELTLAGRAALTEAGLDVLLPYSSVADPLSESFEDTTGSALYSRFPMTDAGVRLNAGGFQQAYGTIHPPAGVPLLVESAHPVAPHSLGTIDGWRLDLANEPVPEPNGPPRVLLGDFNATLDHEPLRRLIGRGYRDAADTVGKGLIPTWGPVALQPARLVTIDHVLVDRRIGVFRVTIHNLPRSDHRAVLAELFVPYS